MNSIPSFVSELVRSANETDRLTDLELAGLLRRSVTVIRDLREVVGIPADGTENDAVIRLGRLAARLEDSTLNDVQRGLLEAADMVRTLWVVIDSGTQISFTASG